jgi:uncharacterized membrane protein YfcA
MKQLHLAVCMNEIIGYSCAALIGISLGLTGSGGSILTVPVLVYLFHFSPLIATSYSLFIVGTTSLVGTVNSYFNRLIDLRTALLFGTSSVATVFVTRKFIVPLIPSHIATIDGYDISFSALIMVLFALLMLLASFSMIRSNTEQERAIHNPKTTLVFYGFIIGIVTGFLGAGGGFLLIPALVLFLGLNMEKAVGTSLFIITINSLIGFLGDTGHYTIDWQFLWLITVIAIAGIFIGHLFGRKIKGTNLKKLFGWFVLIVAVYILVKEIFFS